MKKIIKAMNKQALIIIGSFFGLLISALLTVIIVGGQTYVEAQNENSRRQQEMNISVTRTLEAIEGSCKVVSGRVDHNEADIINNEDHDEKQDVRITEAEKKLIEHDVLIKNKDQ